MDDDVIRSVVNALTDDLRITADAIGNLLGRYPFLFLDEDFETIRTLNNYGTQATTGWRPGGW